MHPPLPVARGKREEAERLEAASSAPPPGHTQNRLFVRDATTGRRFLIDSGADVSVIPGTASINNKLSELKLYAANGTVIPTYGYRVLDLDLGLRRKFQWPFFVAKTSKGILGADFLKNFNLLIDLKNQKLIDNNTKLSTKGSISAISQTDCISTVNSQNSISKLLKNFSDITKPKLIPTEPKHQVKHYIQTTNGPPLFCKARRLDREKLEIAKKEFNFMLENNIIKPSKSQWASPIHLTTKKNGQWRVCGDYRRLNDRTIPDRYPIPRIEDVHHILENKKIFSKIDLHQAFYQIPIAPEDREKTAVITPFGLYEFNYMPFGLRNAPSSFQRFINEVLRDFDFCFAYLDDILIASPSKEEHQKNILQVLKKLDEFGLKINLEKSQFESNEINFLGFKISSEGLKPDPEKVEAILKQKPPKTIKELRTFLGMLNFYRRHMKNAADDQALLNEYLKGATKNDKREVKWTEEALQKFEKCKKTLSEETLLTIPSKDLPISLFVDASNFAVGASLNQLQNETWRPISFFSKKLNATQQKYSAYDRELLAIYLAIKNFRHLIEGRDFTIYTDHKPLIFAFKQKNEKASPRQLRQLQFISEFTTNIVHIKGEENTVADNLSRIEEIKEISPINYSEIAKDQDSDQELQNLIKNNKSLKFEKCLTTCGETLWCDTSQNNIRPYIPGKFRRKIFENFHNFSHPGIKATTKLITQKFIWEGMKKDINQWSQACINCQKNKVTRHTKTSLGTFDEPDERFSIVHLDLIGPLPPSENKAYCLTCIDRFTSWMEVIPLTGITAEEVANEFFKNWIARFGTPSKIITDQGRQFESNLFRCLANKFGIKLQHTTPYHPQSNGKVERLHRTLKVALKAANNIRWTETLPTVLLGLRAVLPQDSQHSTAEMLYGKPIKLPGEFFIKNQNPSDENNLISKLHTQMEQLRPVSVRNRTSQNIFVHKDLPTCTHVFVRVDRVKKPLEPAYEGPYGVVERTDKYYKLNIKGKLTNISLDRLKPAYTLAPEDTSSTSQKPPQGEEKKKEDTTPQPNTNPEEIKTRSGRRVKFPTKYKDMCKFSE